MHQGGEQHPFRRRTKSSIRGRGTRLPLALVLALALIAALPVSASGSDEELTNAVVAPFELDAYQKQFGVSAEVARERLELQHRGIGIVRQLEAVQGDNFAGVWFDNEKGEFVVPMVPAAKEAIVEAALNRADLRGDYRLSLASNTWDELEAAQGRLNNALATEIHQRQVSTSLDPRTNAIVVAEAENPRQDERLINELAVDVPVDVEVHAKPVDQFSTEAMEACARHFSEFWTCERPARGGNSINASTGEPSKGCSMGFKAVGKEFGNRFMLTAGHCYRKALPLPEQLVTNWEGRDKENFAHYLGFVSAAAWPGPDYAAIRVNGYGKWWEEVEWPSIVAYPGLDDHIPIGYESSSYVGESICRSGTKSGGSCGVVSKVDVTEGYKDEFGQFTGTAEHMTKAEGPELFANHGDSGGPVWTGVTALGLLSGGCFGVGCGSNYILYQEITGATAAMGVSVGTPAGARPYVETVGASPVEPFKATAQLKVDPNGLATEYKVEYGTTTSYGSNSFWSPAGSGWGTENRTALLPFLTPRTIYHYRGVAKNAEGTVVGADQSFETPGSPPIISTGSPTGVSSSKVTFNGTVNPENEKTTYYFKYGPTTAYGFKTPETTIEGITAKAVSASLSGIEFGRTLHYQLYAVNGTGATAGPDQVVTPGWLKQSNPKPQSSTSQEHFRSVSCTSQLHCIAVGGFQAGPNIQPLAERWNGTSWEILDFKTPKEAYDVTPEDVSCASPTFCIAVGQYTDLATGKHLTLAESWNGSEWSIQASKNGTEKVNILSGVSCTASNACTAVGTLIQRWNGSEWTLQWAAGSVSGFNDVSCSSATECMAVGYGGLAQRWDGSKWNEANAVKVGEGANLEDVSCPSTTNCMAVGFSLNGGPSQQDTVAEVWNGTKWEVKPTPTFTGVSRLFGVSCSSTTACIAVGYPGDALRPLADRWNGSSWEFQVPPAPEPTPNLIAFEGVSCTSASACMAAGYSRYSAMEALTETYHQTPSPTLTTKAATGVKETEATLNGSINPNDTSSKYWFEYGPTASYGTKTAEVSVSGMSSIEVSKAISGISAGTTYHFRLVASNATGVVYGADQAFEATIDIPARLSALAVLDPFNGKAAAGSDFSKDWTALGWTGGLTPKGKDNENGWGPSDAHPTVNGASFKTSYNDTGSGVASVATMNVSPSNVERYFALWVDMPTPGSTKAGYEVWVRYDGLTNSTVGLWKWSGGSVTVLAEKAMGAIVPGTSFAIVDRGNTVSVWRNTGPGFTELMSKSDSSYSSGWVGVQGAGNITRLTNFKAGSL